MDELASVTGGFDALQGSTVRRRRAEAFIWDYVRALAVLAGPTDCDENRSGWPHPAILCEHGRFFRPRPLPARILPMPAGCCRDNVAALVAKSADLEHVEGVAYGFYPVWHAWAIEADGSVVDPTWPSTRVGLGAAYFGVVRQLGRDRR